MEFSNKRKTFVLLTIAFLYLVANLFTLPFFPFFHSDEIWLSNQSLDIFITKSFRTTESFFDLYPRTPHALKLIFNIIQILFGLLLGHNFLTYRLLSLIVSTLALFFFYKILLGKDINDFFAILITISLGFNIQWFYMSHFARQEPFIVLIYLLTYYLYDKGRTFLACIALITGFFIHPNSYIIALIYFILFILKKDKKALGTGVLICGIATLTIIATSLLLNPHFISAYTSYGDSLGVGASLIERTGNFKDFFIKLYYGISGTYYVPDIRLFLIALAILTVFSFFMTKKEPWIPATLWGYVIGSWIIGRYNATSIIFVIPILYYVLAKLTEQVNKKIAWILITILTFSSLWTITSETFFWYDSYDDFSSSIDSQIPDEGIVLANLNMAYGLTNNQFYDYRNLGELRDQSFIKYIEDRNISYLIWTDEMDYLARNSQWQILYGDMSYYEEAKEYLDNKCTLIHTFEDNLYGTRIVRYMKEPSWKIYIYKVKGK